MVDGMERGGIDILKTAFELGYSNAATSFGRMANDKVHFNNFHFGVHKLDSSYLSTSSFSRNGSNLIITTDIFGDVTGRSYLLLSEAEFNLLTKGIPESKDPKVNFKEEFAKELDNILSASVITKLSNELSRKMYGDIPILVGKVNDKIEDIIYNDFNQQTEEVYINSTFFSFEKSPEINPFFIWVIDKKAISQPKEAAVFK